MHRKLHDYALNSNEQNETGSLAKKLKCENIDNNETKQSTNTFATEVDKLTQNDFVKLNMLSNVPTQNSSTIHPNRKRRSRNTHELLENNSSNHCSATNVNGQVRKKSDLSCVVCCAVAHGYNFDAISCESCKAFFRRNALFSTDRLKCRRDGFCEITLETRRRCKSCRLKKCFAVGMRKEWILTDEEKINKKKRIEENKKLRRFVADDGEKGDDLDLQSILLNKDEKPSLKSTLSAQNSDMIRTIVMAYNDSIKLDLTGYGWSYPLARKITALNQIINTRNTTALRLISFFKRLHDFDILSEADKVYLIKTNLHYLFFLHGSLKYDPVHDVYHEENTDDKPVYGSDIREAYGIDKYHRCTKIMRALHSIVQIDKRIMQVSLVIFLFSRGFSNTVNLNELSSHNHQQLFQIQNKYTEQLWSFLEKTYGRIRTVSIFSTLISKCLVIEELLRDIQQDVYEKLDPCQVPPILRSIMETI